MPGSLARSQESSECKVSLKGVLHQPVGECRHRAPPPAQWKKKCSQQILLSGPGSAVDYSSVSSFHSCALLDARELHVCVFFFLHDFSFPKTKALTLLLVPPEKFTKEAEGSLK